VLRQLGGLEVDVAADAAAAAAMAAVKAYDLYLLDADMAAAAAAEDPAAAAAAGIGGGPGGAAGALARRLRALEAATAGRREATLVGVSGKASEDVGLVEAGYAAVGVHTRTQTHHTHYVCLYVFTPLMRC
jgi:CheY-like chemotaxis protein